MKKIIISTAFLGLAMTACQKKDVAIKTDEDKVSYAIGQEIGSGMKANGMKINVDVLAMSIREAMDGKESKMKPEEMQTAMMNMRKKMMEDQQKQAEDNKKIGSDYLAKNKDKEGVKTTETGLQYEVITEGKGKKPSKEDVVKVHYKGTLIDGSEFDSSYKRNQPAEFPVGRVIPGWVEALQLMPVGSKWKLHIPSELAYGPQGRPKIPPNSVLIFEVELLDIVKPEADKKPKKKS